ncbi:transposase [Thermodesulfovibrio yellowstonii]|uniref:transposase n=1 Tax=Thermodesulfovibrio yellowstonii TaxID=28262 RepID=UPI0024B3C045|nr:transposase [Thermodesulfovibrio yellowstonii]MDI6865794.1 transposase [Thermodesulfovibrio yellowstonii]
MEELARLSNKSYDAVKKAVNRGKFKLIKYVQARGYAGKRLLIHLTDPAVPAEAQLRWIEENREVAIGLKKETVEKFHPQAQWEIVKLKQPKERIMIEKVDTKKTDRIELVQKALRVPLGWKRSEWVAHVASEAGITPQALYCVIKKYKEGGVAAIACKRQKGLSAWSPEALEYMQAVYLRGIRESGEMNKLKAYEAVLVEAEKRGWKVGRKSSAYEYLGRLNPLLEKYARGGTRALDNVFYIVRNYKDLAPFEVIVGDQHRFDFFVHDREADRVLRPEGYFFVDLRTRLTYGFAIAERYDSYLMGLALRMGLKRFGKFGTLYTDNGKPENSRYINSIILDLKAFGMQAKDIVELYRTEDGYAIEEEEGKVIEVVPSVAAWRKWARPYNAKAKLIERYFQSIEKIMLDLGVPGRVKELKDTSEEKAVSDERIRELKEEGKLLDIDEFAIKVFEAVQVYEARRHSGLGRSPLDELMYAVKEEGFIPKMLVEPEIDFVLLKRETRSVNRGRVRVDGMLYEGRELEAGLWDVPDGTKVEVRYDLLDRERALAIKPDRSIVELELVQVSSMKDPEITSALMERKRRFIREVKQLWKKLTAPVKGIIEYSKYTKASITAKKRKDKDPREELRDMEAFKATVQRKIEETKRLNERVPAFKHKTVFQSDMERYKYLLSCICEGFEITEADRVFMQKYEERMDKSERLKWENFKKLYHYERRISNAW